MAERRLIHGVGAPLRARGAVACAHGEHQTGPAAGADDRVIRARRTVHEVPLARPGGEVSG
jgi:hypothetical protein